MQDMQEGAYPTTKKEESCWTEKLNREDYGVDKYWVLLAVVKE